jgi:Zn finger protein HypA/HybF involved in hydrogenase expression
LSDTKTKGRPKGSKNVDVDVVDFAPTVCKCGSTNRGPYFNKRELHVAGICQATGQAYTSIVLRRTQCTDCEQHRDDRQLVNQPRAKAA